MRVTTHLCILPRRRTSGGITPLLLYSFMVCAASSLPPPYVNKSCIRIDKFHSVMCTTGIANDYNHRTTQKSSKDKGKRASNSEKLVTDCLTQPLNMSVKVLFSSVLPNF
jgi:hypothetical protein